LIHTRAAPIEHSGLVLGKGAFLIECSDVVLGNRALCIGNRALCIVRRIVVLGKGAFLVEHFGVVLGKTVVFKSTGVCGCGRKLHCAQNLKRVST